MKLQYLSWNYPLFCHYKQFLNLTKEFHCMNRYVGDFKFCIDWYSLWMRMQQALKYEVSQQLLCHRTN